MSTSRLPTASDAGAVLPVPVAPMMAQTPVRKWVKGLCFFVDFPIDFAAAIANLGIIEPCDVTSADDAASAHA